MYIITIIEIIIIKIKYISSNLLDNFVVAKIVYNILSNFSCTTRLRSFFYLKNRSFKGIDCFNFIVYILE